MKRKEQRKRGYEVVQKFPSCFAVVDVARRNFGHHEEAVHEPEAYIAEKEEQKYGLVGFTNAPKFVSFWFHNPLTVDQKWDLEDHL